MAHNEGNVGKVLLPHHQREAFASFTSIDNKRRRCRRKSERDESESIGKRIHYPQCSHNALYAK